MQIDLLDAQRRVQARVPLPWIRARCRVAAPRSRPAGPRGGPIRRHSDRLDRLPAVASTDRRHSAPLTRSSTAQEHQQILKLARDGDALPALVAAWYQRDLGRDAIRRQHRRRRRCRISIMYWRWPSGRFCRDRPKPSCSASTFRAGSTATARSAGGNLTSRRSRPAATGD